MNGKDAVKDIPSWARGQRPFVGENGKTAARRVMDEQYGPGKWSETSREYQQLKKHFDRGFRNPANGFPGDLEA